MAIDPAKMDAEQAAELAKDGAAETAQKGAEAVEKGDDVGDAATKDTSTDDGDDGTAYPDLTESSTDPSDLFGGGSNVPDNLPDLTESDDDIDFGALQGTGANDGPVETNIDAGYGDTNVDLGDTDLDNTATGGVPPWGSYDSDGDGLTNDEELKYGTDPFLTDTDGGGVSDFDEVNAGFDPTDRADDAEFDLG